jgi:hypothetical protein
MVNTGYIADDVDIVDYQPWQLPRVGLKVRGPAPAWDKPRFVAMGAAQTFGRFVPRPYGAIIAERTGSACLNFGFSGAGPSFFNIRPPLFDYINASDCAVVQVLSGRSVSNSAFKVGNNQGVVTPRGATSLVAPIFAEDAYKELLRTTSKAELIRIRDETRDIYISQMIELLTRITVPKILVYWSVRPVDYEEGTGDLQAYWGNFPHFVNRNVIDSIRPHADSFLECVSRRGLPQPLRNRQTGEPIVLFPADRFPSIQLRDHNHYYASPEMHEDVADAIMKIWPPRFRQ